MITSLTPEQEALLPAYRDKWLKIGLDTSPINHSAAISAVHLLYSCGGQPAPKEILFAEGPIRAKELLSKFIPNASIVDSCVYGSHEAYWLGFYDFFESECAVDFEGKLRGLMAVARECGWIISYDEFAIVLNKPSVIKMDEQNRLHCENGPAIRYEDGFAVYSWHGVRVPSKWIENKSSLSARDALKQSNLELRRAACEILGWVHILKELKAKIINQDEDPMIGTLLEVSIPDIGKEKFLHVLCGTGREFALPVPPDMKTALEANAWTYGLKPIEYAPEIRT